MRMFSELRQRSKPDVIRYNAALSACGACGEWNYAFGLLEEMKGEQTWPDVTSYSAAITACEKGDCVEEALKMFGELRERHKPNVISYNAAISACGADGKWRRALGLVEEMKAERTLPNVTSYSAAITACEKGGCVEEALKMFGELRERHKPNVIS